MSDDAFAVSYNRRRRAAKAGTWLAVLALLCAPAARGAAFAAVAAAALLGLAANLLAARCPSCGRFIGALPLVFAAGGRRPACADEASAAGELDLPD